MCQIRSRVVNKHNLSSHRFALMVTRGQYWQEVGGEPKAVAFTGQPDP